MQVFDGNRLDQQTKPQDEDIKAKQEKAKKARALKLKKVKVFRCEARVCLLMQRSCDCAHNLVGTSHACAQHMAARVGMSTLQ